MTDRRKISKRRSLEEVKQKLYQAEASGNKFQIMVWKSVLNKLEEDKSRDSKK